MRMKMEMGVRLAVAVLCFSLVGISATTAQMKYKEGAVERVVLLHVLPGHFDAFMDDLKTNIVPIWEAQKKAGLIQDYQMFLNTTRSSGEEWDFGYSLIFKNMAALDGLPDKVYELRMKQYGSPSAEQKVIDKRVENVHIVSSYLPREITLR